MYSSAFFWWQVSENLAQAVLAERERGRIDSITVKSKDLFSMFSWHAKFRDSNDDLVAVSLFTCLGSLLCFVLFLFSVRLLPHDRKNGHGESQTTSLHRCFKGSVLPLPEQSHIKS